MKFSRKFFTIKAVGVHRIFFEIRAKEQTMKDLDGGIIINDKFLTCQAVNLYQARDGLWKKQENGEYEAQDIFKWSDSLSEVIYEMNAKELKRIGCYSSS